ncbi:MAG TPA: hypothetical protein VJ725_21470 [Thermoanaerobaculia bacterium]|nr:hypothetical protein [Thermoanaerobaculia bacterium]
MYELRGHKTSEPAPRGPRPVGSSNFGVVANLCEVIANKGRDMRAAEWLVSWYRRQGPGGDLGHCAWEPLSHVYGDPHITAALLMIAAAKKWASRLDGVQGEAAELADEFLARELALCLLHRAPGGRISHAGTRSNAPKAGERSPARESFVDLALGGLNVRAGRIERAQKLANWSAPLALHDAARSAGLKRVDPRDLQPWLGEIRFAPGPLIVTHHENGHCSRFETGPICYQSPMPACVVRYEPREVWPKLAKGKGHGELTTEVVDGRGLVVSSNGSIYMEPVSLDSLGAVVAEHRIEGIRL